MASVRSAAVAGMFYPGDARSLLSEVDELLGGVEPAPRLGFPKALVVPHAGYIYSGPVAARAYDELAPARGIVRRVVLLGPVHRVAVRGLAVPTDSAFVTPLGQVPIDAQALASVRDLPQVVASDAAHLQEHALEVQLPFLRRQGAGGRLFFLRGLRARHGRIARRRGPNAHRHRPRGNRTESLWQHAELRCALAAPGGGHLRDVDEGRRAPRVHRQPRGDTPA